VRASGAAGNLEASRRRVAWSQGRRAWDQSPAGPVWRHGRSGSSYGQCSQARGRRGPYYTRHSSVTWQLMPGKYLLWVAKQRGHSVEVMLRMYAAWLDGATGVDIYAIKQAMEKKNRGAQRNSRFSCCNFGCKSSGKSREIYRDSSPRVPRIWR
jgi:hypothetical protein